jgi:putative endonuclease
VFKTYFVYMLASRRNGTLYTGVTNDLRRRVHEHRAGQVPGFTKTYCVTNLVWFESHDDIAEAIAREKRIKRWARTWKLALIEERNPDWADLYEGLGL